MVEWAVEVDSMRMPHTRSVRWLLAAAVIGALAASVRLPASAGEATAEGGTTTERVVVDQATGFAIGGFDAVAFFIDRRPVDGVPGFETSYDGAIWRFASKGNRDAFADTPDLYAPQYGGHCARSAAVGIAAEADPRIFVLYKGRLYFFRREPDRDLWLKAPEAHVAAAGRNWPRLIETLAR
jgi:YHS domain-containing protein